MKTLPLPKTVASRSLFPGRKGTGEGNPTGRPPKARNAAPGASGEVLREEALLGSFAAGWAGL